MTCMVFDFDGVLHEHAAYANPFGALNFEPIREAHDRGYPVAVSTCNDTWRVAEALQDAGFYVLDDQDHRYGQLGWDGGRTTGRVVLVTNMKVSGWLVDDRAMNWHYGDSTNKIWSAVRGAELARKARTPGNHRAGRPVRAEQRECL
jgi:hypothetical protein